VKTFLALFSLHFWQQGSIQQKVLVSVIAIILVVVIAAAIFNAFKARRRPANTSASVDAASNTERSLEDVPRNHFLGQALLQGAELSSDVAARSGGTAQPASSIEDFLSAWWNLSGGAHGTAHDWQMSAKRKGLDEFLRVYQRTHQRLPQGLITFSYISLSSGRTVEETIDADEIHRHATVLNACFSERGDYRLDRMVSAVPERPSSF
jgi:hypothetical protein